MFCIIYRKNVFISRNFLQNILLIHNFENLLSFKFWGIKRDMFLITSSEMFSQDAFQLECLSPFPQRLRSVHLYDCCRTLVACNYVLYAILSGGHYCILSARTHLHMQSCPSCSELNAIGRRNTFAIFNVRPLGI